MFALPLKNLDLNYQRQVLQVSLHPINDDFSDTGCPSAHTSPSLPLLLNDMQPHQTLKFKKINNSRMSRYEMLFSLQVFTRTKNIRELS